MTTSPSDPTEEIKAAVRALWAAWTKRPNDEEQAAWAKSLRPYWDRPSLRQAMRAATEGALGDWIPTVPQLLGKMRAIESSTPTTQRADQPLDERAQRRAQRAAVLSLLWLHYEFGWSLEYVGSHLLASLFGGDPRAAIAAAKEQYTHATIRRWMADQAANNPAPCDKTLGQHLCG
jgi:hypothetical protein